MLSVHIYDMVQLLHLKNETAYFKSSVVTSENEAQIKFSETTMTYKFE